ncbi:unnamed protein product [Phytophthora fragariaefolia]|uniref:Unnamed protein product n=1 Tax=Phytophthora fragariaefolia TaxID=1490495 RepID=A0A9W6TXP1_9STRA|nr:unnamed protein product [Phytophthora fragariaefolia]
MPLQRALNRLRQMNRPISEEDWLLISEMEGITNQLAQFSQSEEQMGMILSPYSLLFHKFISLSAGAKSIDCLIISVVRVAVQSRASELTHAEPHHNLAFALVSFFYSRHGEHATYDVTHHCVFREERPRLSKNSTATPPAPVNDDEPCQDANVLRCNQNGAFPDYSRIFHVFADASGRQIGGLVVQDKRVIACLFAAGLPLYNLESDTKRFGSMAKRIDDFSQLATTEDLCVTMIQHDMNRIYPTLYRLVCALSVTSAGVERSSSAKKRVKTRLRTTLGDAWLGNLLLLTLKSDLTKTMDKDAVIEAFNEMAHHRAPPPSNLRAGFVPGRVSLSEMLNDILYPHTQRRPSKNSTPKREGHEPSGDMLVLSFFDFPNMAEAARRLAACSDAGAIAAELRAILPGLSDAQDRRAAVDDVVAVLVAERELCAAATQTLFSEISGDLSAREVHLELLDAVLGWATQEAVEQGHWVLEILQQYFQVATRRLGDGGDVRRWLKWGDQVLEVVHKNAALLETWETQRTGEGVEKSCAAWRNCVVALASSLLQLSSKVEGGEGATPDLKTVTFVWKVGLDRYRAVDS